jgi:hypothetical protein
MNSIENKELAPALVHPEITTHALPPESWEKLCAWLTENLKGIGTTIERRQPGGEWGMECLEHRLEGITTHQANGVQIISVNMAMNGHHKLFAIAGPCSITLCKNAAGWPEIVEIGTDEGKFVMRFSGPPEPRKRMSSNAWGE